MGSPEKGEGRVTHPAPQKTAIQPPTTIAEDTDSVDDLGFFRKALSGKVRPDPREPGVTHYGCSCCRWSA